MTEDPILQPLHFRNLKVKNRVFRSSISGRFDHYNGTGSPARINWELKFARGGVGAIISSFVPVQRIGRILPNYATIDHDGAVPFWRELVSRVHEHGCKYLIQLSHSGRQRDIPSLEFPGPAPSSTSRPETLHGLPARAMTVPEIKEIVRCFAQGARRAREAGADGVELHGANGYLITQFLSSGINDRKDDYGGPLENRARFVREIVQAIRKEVGRDFHLQMKISATEHHNDLFPWEGKGNTVDESVQVVKWLEEDGIDAVHVSTGSSFPHPRNPGGGFAVEDAAKTYDVMSTSGSHTFRNLLIFRNWPFNALFKWWWGRRGDSQKVEGANLEDSRKIRQAVGVPVLCTGGFQTASVIRGAITSGACDGVTIARPLIANPDLVQIFQRGEDRPERPCTYCNRCLVNVLKNPLGCYEPARFPDHDAMVADIMSVYRDLPGLPELELEEEVRRAAS